LEIHKNICEFKTKIKIRSLDFLSMFSAVVMRCTQGYDYKGKFTDAELYPKAGISAACFPYCGPKKPYSQPFVMVKFRGIKHHTRTAAVCVAELATNIGNASETVQQRDRLATTSLAFVISRL